jgi:PHD/YefM family antitoxin component YafN of YafNO toxin-antitoxin module
VRFAARRVDFDTLMKEGATMTALDEPTQVSDFERDPDVFADRLRETGAAVVLTTRGGHRLVVQDLGAYEALLERLGQAETVAALREAMESHERGESRPAREVLDEIRLKHGIPR